MGPPLLTEVIWVSSRLALIWLGARKATIIATDAQQVRPITTYYSQRMLAAELSVKIIIVIMVKRDCRVKTRQTIRAVALQVWGEPGGKAQDDLEKSKLIINLRHYNKRAIAQDITIMTVAVSPLLMRQQLLTPQIHFFNSIKTIIFVLASNDLGPITRL